MKVAPAPTSASVAEAFLRARRHGERAAMLDHLADLVPYEFAAAAGQPRFHLQRSGEGPRPATLDAVL